MGNHTIVHRPGLYPFLDATCQLYELVVFTAGTKEYADSVLNSIDPEGKYFSRRFYRSSCKFRDGVYCKDLRSVGSDLSRTIIIDNIPENYAMQPENGIPIVDFIGDEYDSALIDLLPLLTGKCCLVLHVHVSL
jgi:CTD small phosphatase-like protein 2